MAKRSVLVDWCLSNFLRLNAIAVKSIVLCALLQHYGMRRVNTRGRSSAHKTMLLTAIAFNLKKLLKHQSTKTLRLAIALPKPPLAGLFLSFWRQLSRRQYPQERRVRSSATATVGLRMVDQLFLKHVDDLKAALVRPSDCEAILQLLLETKPDTAVLASLLPAVLDKVVDSTWLMAIDLAKEVVAAYGTEPAIRSGLALLLNNYLPGHDEWRYRHIAELYDLLNYQEELTSFLALCRASSN